MDEYATWLHAGPLAGAASGAEAAESPSASDSGLPATTMGESTCCCRWSVHTVVTNSPGTKCRQHSRTSWSSCGHSACRQYAVFLPAHAHNAVVISLMQMYGFACMHGCHCMFSQVCICLLVHVGPVADAAFMAGDASAASLSTAQQQPSSSQPASAPTASHIPNAAPGRVSPFAAAATARWSSGALDAAVEPPAAQPPAAEPAPAAAMQQQLEVPGIPPGLAPIKTSMPGQQPRLLHLLPVPQQQPAPPASSQPTPAAAAGPIWRLLQDIGSRISRGIKRLRGDSAAEEEQEAVQQPGKKQAVEASTGRPAAAAARKAAQHLQEDSDANDSPATSPAGSKKYEPEDVPPAAAAAAAAAAPPAAVPGPLEAAMQLLSRSGASASEIGLLQAAAEVIPCQQARTYRLGYHNYRRLAGHKQNLQLQDLVLIGQNVDVLVMAICCWLAAKQSAHEVPAAPEVVAGRLRVSLPVLDQVETAVGTVLMYGSLDGLVEQLMQAAPAAAPSPLPAAAAAAAAPPPAVQDPLEAAMKLLPHSSASASEPGLLQAAAKVIPCQRVLTYLVGYSSYSRLAGHKQNLQLQDLVLIGQKVDFMVMVACCWLATKQSVHEVAAAAEVVADRLQVPLSVLHQVETAIGAVLMYGNFDEFVEQLREAAPAAAPAEAVPAAGDV